MNRRLASGQNQISQSVLVGTLSLLLLVVVIGCNEAKNADSSAPATSQATEPIKDAKADAPADSASEPSTTEQAATQQTEAPANEAKTIEVEFQQSNDQAQLVSAETNLDSPIEDQSEESPATDDLGKPTHKQIATISVNTDTLPETSLHSFCLAPDGNVLAACGEQDNGEIRIFDPDGNYLRSWEVAIKPEAINVGSDGNVYLAGQGKLLKLNQQGEQLLEKESPHVASILADPDAIREEVIQRAKRQVSSYDKQLEMYQKMIDQLEKKEEAELSESEQKSLEQLKQVYEQIEEVAKENTEDQLSDEKIDDMVKSMIEYKMRTASISEADGSVYIATGESTGYGYAIWRMDENFENAESIVGKLRGCCGQMDVQACSTGVYVAENSRHRVVRFDNQGTKLTSWGSRARSGLRGFGSCCNPMNVNFGPDGTVYTAESNTGRIKQYDSEGQLLSLVGKVDLVPGCKKVAIAVSPDGSRIYMLDITRETILVMGPLAPGESIAYSETDQGDSASTGVLKILRKAVGL